MRAAAILMAAALAAPLSPQAAPSERSYWERDIWQEPDRPFLYYGIKETLPEDPQPQKGGEKPLEAIETLADLKAERERRLEAAVMSPTRENILAYLEVNAFVQEKSARFADAWRDALLQSPHLDWTAAHPTANFASTAISRQRQEDIEGRLRSLPKDVWGLVLFADGSHLSELMAPVADRFAAGYGFELVRLSVAGTLPFLPLAQDAAGLEKRSAGGLSHFPALLLVKRGPDMLANARILATGAVDSTELGRRLIRLVHQDAKGNTP